MQYKVAIIIVLFLTTSLALIDGYSQEVFPNKPLISNGLYLNIGVGFPARTYRGYTSNLDPQINLEVGNQYLILKNEKWGAGFKISWFQFGYGANRYDIGASTSSSAYRVPTYYRVHTFDIRIFKVGPQYSVALTSRVALDITIDICPTALYSIRNTYGYTSSFRYLGIFVGPNLRLRYKKWTLGAEIAFGRLTYKDLDKYSNSNQMSYPSNYIYPRVYLGFQF